MLNLELLIWVAEQTNNDSLYHIACSHANVTKNNHFRKNFSCYHLVDYDPADGSTRKKQTVQGLVMNLHGRVDKHGHSMDIA